MFSPKINKFRGNLSQDPNPIRVSLPLPPTKTWKCPDDESNVLIDEEYDYLNFSRQREREFKIAPDYMRNQPVINARMRTMLTDWLVCVHQHFKFKANTLLLTVSLIDRYLALIPVSSDKLQLVGITAMVCFVFFHSFVLTCQWYTYLLLF